MYGGGNRIEPAGISVAVQVRASTQNKGLRAGGRRLRTSSLVGKVFTNAFCSSLRALRHPVIMAGTEHQLLWESHVKYPQCIVRIIHRKWWTAYATGGNLD